MTKTALIVAHGQPSDPDGAETALAALAAQVAQHLPGWHVRSATLAKPGALAAAGQGGGLVYPMFMAGGWFTKIELPRRMAEAGLQGWTHLAPFGLDPALQDLAVTIATEAAGPSLAQTALLLAAHGSGRSRAPAEVAGAMAARLAAAGFARAEAYFIEEDPRLETATGFGERSICLPFFAAEGGHVTDDLPEALRDAGFTGRVLPPLGVDPRVPALIAASLQRALR